ncbi:magnesium chelatase subunit D [Fertoebacter nigrum]|uniref:Magnesium chelatase subunit D n=1 Tax=Fertoeibacter niger TaxID=2656921 RepID=A0A8X8GUT3_9RHOB|nr:magnesium chelatase subunit D [Fertoeibacter niger]
MALEPWARVETALALLAVDPAGLKGLWLRARAGPLRDRVTLALSAIPLPARRLHPGIEDQALFGGLDLAATLAGGVAARTTGLLADPAALVLAMAERCPPGLAARLGAALDAPGHSLIALDEGDADEALPPGLADRLALFVDLEGLGWGDSQPVVPDLARLSAARAALPQVELPPDAAETLARVAATLGIASLRAPTLALAAARAGAALAGRSAVTDDDLRLACDLVYAHRALPAAAEAEPPPAEDTPPEDTLPDNLPPEPQDSDRFPEEMLVEAARAALPADLLARLAAARAARVAKGATGSGAAKAGNRRGRPLPSRAGRLGSGQRIDLVATLRAAAPWQPLRRAQAALAAGLDAGQSGGVADLSHPLSPRSPSTLPALLLRPSDIRLKRFMEMSDRVLIFAVDASGSSAMARLAETKGAVELLLAQAYARRDHVALLAFRGRAAELILPPTRSLVQTKRRLAGLPGGGATPLAHGLQMALAVGQQARARGLTPTIALMTDGRGNIALDGTANRAQAEADALQLARVIGAARLPALVIDTASRPQPALQTLARALGGTYLALPRADAHRMAVALSGALGG